MPSYSSTASAEAQLDRIENGEISTSNAYGMLKEIINDLAGTPTAERAKRLMKDLFE